MCRVVTVIAECEPIHLSARPSHAAARQPQSALAEQGPAGEGRRGEITR